MATIQLVSSRLIYDRSDATVQHRTLGVRRMASSRSPALSIFASHSSELLNPPVYFTLINLQECQHNKQCCAFTEVILLHANSQCTLA